MRKLRTEEISARRLPREGAINAERLPIIGLLDNIRSLYNVGSIFRTSDGALIRHLYLTGYTPKPPRQEIEKTALGATETVPWSHFTNPLDAIQTARQSGARICVLEQTTGSVPYFKITPSDFPVCLVVGNELTGISPEVVAVADMALDIPMFGTKHSLNAAVAYGIAIFELVRVWKMSQPPPVSPTDRS
ncbi:TrmH family RNA methyltransferase [bacterium]|nr:MAG: TrmH family RNA methyltransferase [bacterium]